MCPLVARAAILCRATVNDRESAVASWVSMESCAINALLCPAVNTDIATTALSAFAKRVGTDSSALTQSADLIVTQRVDTVNGQANAGAD